MNHLTGTPSALTEAEALLTYDHDVHAALTILTGTGWTIDTALAWAEKRVTEIEAARNVITRRMGFLT